MPNPFTPAQVKIQSPARGSGTQNPFDFFAKSFQLTWSWGLQPSTAPITWVSTSGATIVPWAQMDILIAGHTFWGVSQNIQTIQASAGREIAQEFADSRIYLTWDPVFCAFNKREDRMVSGVYKKRYKHLLPANHRIGRWTYTDTAYTAQQILEFLFTAPTIQTTWVRVYTGLGSILNMPVYELDFLNGPTLGAAITQVSERAGTVFTLMGGRYQLVWCRKGSGLLPLFPSNSDTRRLGQAMSQNFSRVYVAGSRNQYQVLNLEMEPDWKPAWEQFYDFDVVFVRDIFDHEKTDAAVGSVGSGVAYNAIPGDTDRQIGYQLAAERAKRITLAQYASLREVRSAGTGAQFKDFRKFQTRSRMQMPVKLYIREVLFRAFRIPATFELTNAAGLKVPMDGLEILERSLVEVSHDPTTGVMSYDTTILSAGNGYAIAKGYLVGIDEFKTLKPEQVDLQKWIDLQSIWQAVPFQIDNSAEGDQFILFDEPVISSATLLQKISISGNLQQYPVLKAGAAVGTPTVRAALVLGAEPFQHIQGTGAKDGVESISELNGIYVVKANGSDLVELAYADGMTALQKAEVSAGQILARQIYYDKGGYIVRGCNATQLTSMIDRVTVSYSAGGLTEDVDFTSERNLNTFDPERNYERRAQIENLLPGERELRREAQEAKIIGIQKASDPKYRKLIHDAFYERMGIERPTLTLIKQ